MDPQHERETLAAEDGHWWYRGRRNIVCDLIASLGLERGAPILDAGCGGGRSLEDLIRFGEVTGLEPSGVSLDVARERDVGRVVEGSILAMPFGDGEFALATSLDVIEHVDDDVGAFRELRRVVRDDGWLLVTVPAYPRLWSSHDVANHHFRRYTRATLLAAARAGGWDPVRTTHFNALLLPVAAVYRSLESRGLARREASELVLTSTPVWLNTVLLYPLLAERAALRRGRDLPAGLSIMALFRARPG